MPTLAPGVYVSERDFSTYAPALGTTLLAIVGGATKGPMNVPTRLTNEGDLIRTFGAPVSNDYALQAAIQFLKKGNNLLFVRVGSASVTTADVDVPGTDGGTASVEAAGTIAFASAINPADGDTVTLRKTVPYATLENDANGALGNTTVTLGGSGVTGRISKVNFTGGGTTTRATAWLKLIGSAVPHDADTVSISDGTNPAKVFEFDNDSTVSGSNIAVAIVASDPYATMANLVSAINAAASLNVSSVNATVTRTFEFDNNGTFSGSNTPVTIGASAAATLSNLISAITGYAPLNMTAADTTVTVPTLTATALTGGIDGNALISKVGTNISVSGMTGGTDAIAGSITTVGVVYAKTPGTWATGVEARIVSPSTEISPLSGSFDLDIWAPVDSSGTLALVERRTNLVLDSSSARYVETAVNDGISGEFGPSEYVTFDALVGAGTVTGGTYALAIPGSPTDANGISDIAAADYIGAYSGQSATGLKALRNPETQEFNVLAVPGVTHTLVINEAIDLCETRGDAFFIIDTPFGLSPQQVLDWHNGTSSIANAPSTPLNTSYAGVYWAWVKEYDPYTKRTLWLPPSGFVAQAFAVNDSKAGPWAIAAGANRGLITGQDIEYKPSIDDRKLLQATASNRINPIISKLDTGLQLYGNRTLQRKTSALENVHTRRMLIYVEKLIATSTQYLVFEPNIEATWRAFENLVRPILSQVKAANGLENFDVISDATTNPPAQRQDKRMKGRILIAAVEGAESIEVEFNLFATGATFSNA